MSGTQKQKLKVKNLLLVASLSQLLSPLLFCYFSLGYECKAVM